MKHLSKLIVKDQVESLNEEEMKLILGGKDAFTYFCCCGKQGETLRDCTELHANSKLYAVVKMLTYCYGNIGVAACP